MNQHTNLPVFGDLFDCEDVADGESDPSTLCLDEVSVDSTRKAVSRFLQTHTRLANALVNRKTPFPNCPTAEENQDHCTICSLCATRRGEGAAAFHETERDAPRPLLLARVFVLLMDELNELAEEWKVDDRIGWQRMVVVSSWMTWLRYEEHKNSEQLPQKLARVAIDIITKRDLEEIYAWQEVKEAAEAAL